MLIKFLKKHRLLIIFSLVFIFLRLPSLFEPDWYGDEGIYLALGEAVRQGSVLYSQIHDNKPPTLYFLAAFAQTVFGFRLLLTLWMIPTIYAFYRLSKKFFSSKLSLISTFLFLVLTSIPLFEGNIANAEVFMLLPTILGVYLVLFSPSPFRFLLSGLLLGFAFTIKVPVVVEFAFLCLWIFIAGLKKIPQTIGNLFVFVFSFFLPIAVYSLYYFSKGAFNDFIFASLLQNFGYLSSWATGTHSGSATSGGLVVRALILFGFWLIICLLIFKKKISWSVASLSLWFSAALFGALLSTRPYPHYLIQILPPLVILLVSLFDSKVLVFAKLIFFSLFVFFGYVFFHYHFYVYPVFSYYRNFYSHLGSLNSLSYRNYFGGAVDETYQISSYLKSSLPASEKLFVWGDSPFIYVLTNHLPVGRFTVAYHIVDFNQYQTIYDQLKIDFPKIIVYYHQNSRPYPQLDDFINRYYSPVKVYGSAVIFQSHN